jgi:hypothetical protein
MAAHITKKQKVDIVKAYTEDLIPVIELAKKIGYTRHGVYSILKRHGVNPSEYGSMQVSCSACGKIITRPRCRIRKQKNHFCTEKCYYAFLEAGNGNPFIENRHKSRLARYIVSELFDLQPEHRVHHKDRNHFNTAKNNLMVFATQGDHVRFHRGFDVTPLWDGEKD